MFAGDKPGTLQKLAHGGVRIPSASDTALWKSLADCIFLKLFFFSFICPEEREYKQWERQAEGEGGSLVSKEPHVGLDQRTLRS